MPGHAGRRLNDDKSATPARPDAAQRDPEQTVTRMESWVLHGSLQHGDLLAQGNVLEGELRAVKDRGAEAGGEGSQD